MIDQLLLLLLLLLLLDSTRLDIRIKGKNSFKKHDRNGRAEPKEPQYKENETLERKSLS